MKPSSKLKILKDDGAKHRVWDPKEESQSIVEGMNREELEKQRQKLKLESFMKYHHRVGKTNTRDSKSRKSSHANLLDSRIAY